MWSSAFGAANDVIREVVSTQPTPRINTSASKDKTNENGKQPKQFATGKKRKQKDVSDSDTDEDECGAFNQPAKLARFMTSIASTETNPLRSVDTLSKGECETDKDGVASDRNDEIETSEPRQRSLEERCSMQICRNWLKHTFLSLGKACKASPCLRLHQLPEQSQRLYNDFSFKGLQSKQQKTILSSYKKKTKDDVDCESIAVENSRDDSKPAAVTNQCNHVNILN